MFPIIFLLIFILLMFIANHFDGYPAPTGMEIFGVFIVAAFSIIGLLYLHLDSKHDK